MKFIKAFGHFWYDFVIGDDWKIAAAVVGALAVLRLLLSNHILTDNVLAMAGGLLIVLFFSLSLLIDTKSPKNRR